MAYRNPKLTRSKIQGRSFRLNFCGHYVGELHYSRACGGSFYEWHKSSFVVSLTASRDARRELNCALNGLPPRLDDACAEIERALIMLDNENALDWK